MPLLPDTNQSAQTFHLPQFEAFVALFIAGLLFFSPIAQHPHMMIIPGAKHSSFGPPAHSTKSSLAVSRFITT
ncbi:hypothetical protein [Vibrio gazogenes]|uniref:Uncharacterized protein n=1 Tax=Vibrio gazogenes TaxID=687 RepID=A0A1Z2SDJ2_VIBGA|nr:hypothetical protein [Vibrio gazogenes]ASA55256.1 hypothetical protein BSQ33_05650 [Vibrio gazogenes]